MMLSVIAVQGVEIEIFDVTRHQNAGNNIDRHPSAIHGGQTLRAPMAKRLSTRSHSSVA